MKKLCIAAIALAALATPALGADLGAAPKPLYKAPTPPPLPAATGYVEVATGWARTIFDITDCETGFGCDSENDKFNGWVLSGAGRGNYWFLPNATVQLDAQAEGTSYSIPSSLLPPGTSDHFSTLAYLVGGHVNWRDSQTGLIGIFGGAGDAGGNSQFSSSERHFVLGGEGQLYWNQFTLYAQGGYDSTIRHLNVFETDDIHAWFVRGTGRWFAMPNLLLEVTGLYAGGAIDFLDSFAMENGSANSWNFHTSLIQAKVEWMPGGTPFSVFGKYQWSQTRYDTFTGDFGFVTEQMKVTDNRFLIGVRLYMGEGTLLSNDRHGATLDIIDPLGTPVSPLMFSDTGEQKVSDALLKRDIDLVGRLANGLGLYRYRYFWSDTVYVGVMAQEVALIRPDAVVRGPDGYLRVDYGRLGLHLMTLSEWEGSGAAVTPNTAYLSSSAKTATSRTF